MLELDDKTGPGVGYRLFLTRTARGYAQAVCAKFLGVTPQAWSKWELQGIPKALELIRAASVLSVEPRWLLQGDVRGIPEDIRGTIAGLHAGHPDTDDGSPKRASRRRK